MLDQSLRGKELAPHEFVQTYTVDNQWGLIRGRYSLLGIDMKAEAGITPQKTKYASDIDTFYQPDGTKVTSNGQLIESIAACARRAGREVASPAEARQRLGLREAA